MVFKWMGVFMSMDEYFLLPPKRAAEIVQCVRKYVDGISQNLQSLSPY